MRLYLPLALSLLLVACGKDDQDQPAIVANIENAEVPEAGNISPPVNEAAPGESGNAAQPPRGEEDDSGILPIALRGRWTGISDNCSDRAAEQELSITPDSLIFHESVGTVTAVERQADGRLRVKAAFTGEGQSWTRSLLLEPAARGRELTIVNDGVAVTRKRCG